MSVYSYSQQVRWVIIIELTLVAIAAFIAAMFWTNVCDDSLKSCLSQGPLLEPLSFILLSAIRPLMLTPMWFTAVIGGDVFGSFWGTLLVAIGNTLSCALVFGITKVIGKRLAKPWLRANLPATLKFIRSQDYKVVFACRLIPFFPFDLMSFLFGALDFRFRSVIIATFIGSLPEAYLVTNMADPNVTVLASTVKTLLSLSLTIFAPLLVFEFISRKRGSSLWSLTRSMYREIVYEVRVNNEIVKREMFDPDKTPVLLLYGFFSSRRSVTVLERMLTNKGHQVLSFNLGGLLGVFFTKGILETAYFIDYKIKRQFERYDFKELQIVAHSKGGMVALWWVLKLGGSKYCKKVITMGTPFQGSRLTYLALVTPLGFLWRDVWQMRPGSLFLKSLHDVEIPQDVEIYCLHSEKDAVVKGEVGLFQPKQGQLRVTSVPMNHISHFEFLYRRDVGEMISKLLNKPIRAGESDSNA